MSYRPSNQSLQPICDRLLKNIKEFSDAVNERIVSGDWTIDHLNEISNLDRDLLALKVRISKLKGETW